MPSRGTGSYPRRGISVRTRWGWGPSASGKMMTRRPITRLSGVLHAVLLRAVLLLAALLLASAAAAQQRPLVTEDPEPIGAGRMLIEAGLDYAHDQQYPASGLQGNLWTIPAM